MINKLSNFLVNSPSSYHAINELVKVLKAKDNYSEEEITKGHTFVFTKETSDGATLVAIEIGKEVDENSTFKVISSHADSPWFKVSKNQEMKREECNLLPTYAYGGQLLQTWYDRPLTLAGRVKVNGKYQLVHLKDETILIPNMCKHFVMHIDNTEMINRGYPIIGSKSNLYDMLTRNLNVKKEDIEDYDLNLIVKQEPILWGDDKEYYSSQRLDDLASAFTTLEAFMSTPNNHDIKVMYVSDNEEIGSNTEVGAFSTFLDECLEKVIKAFNLKEDVISRSFNISADNAQACNPLFPYMYNPDYKIYLNKGLAIKFSERYSTTEATANYFYDLCKKNNLPYQIYYNRSDIAGGGTIGKIIQKHLNIPSVDVGIPELAMHSSLETIGTFDVSNTIKVFEAFYKD